MTTAACGVCYSCLDGLGICDYTHNGDWPSVQEDEHPDLWFQEYMDRYEHARDEQVIAHLMEIERIREEKEIEMAEEFEYKQWAKQDKPNISGQKAFLLTQYWCFSISERRRERKQQTHKQKTLRSHRNY